MLCYVSNFGLSWDFLFLYGQSDKKLISWFLGVLEAFLEMILLSYNENHDTLTFCLGLQITFYSIFDFLLQAPTEPEPSFIENTFLSRFAEFNRDCQIHDDYGFKPCLSNITSNFQMSIFYFTWQTICSHEMANQQIIYVESFW